jgi:hypothetical protein
MLRCAEPSRRAYTLGCRCQGCRAAEAAAKAAYRRRVAAGRPRWGQHVAVGETSRRLLALIAEYGTATAVAHALRLRNGHLHFRKRPTITLRTYARVASLFRSVHEP